MSSSSGASSSSSSSSTSSSHPCIGQKRKSAEEWEPPTLLEFEDFKRMNLEELLRMLFENFHLAWQRNNYAQKFYGMAKQCFIKRMCRLNRTATEAFQFTKIVTHYIDADDELDDIIDLTILRQYESNYVEILD